MRDLLRRSDSDHPESALKAARLSAIFPSAVVEGMLASIGLLIIAKQLPYLMGVKFEAKSFFEYLAEFPGKLPQADFRIFALGLACLASLFILSSSKITWVRKVPPQLIVVSLGVLAGQMLGLQGSALIHLPHSVLEHGIVFPDFQGLMADSTLYSAVLITIVTLTLFDGVESLATAAAMDRIDPFHRKSNPDRTLLAMGICNIASSLAGGLTIIPGGVKSKACIVAGGRTLWANLYNAVFLVLYISLFTSLINLIPYTAQASILIYSGYRMCEPKLWRHVRQIGPEQLFLFAATVLITLSTDLLIGIIAGTLLKLCVSLYFDARMGRSEGGLGLSLAQSLALLPERAKTMFKNPVGQVRLEGETYDMNVGGPVVCFNSQGLSKAIERIPAEARRVRIYLSDKVSLIDHTSVEILLHLKHEFASAGRGVIELVGL